MNDVQRQLYINKHTGETACYISKRKIMQFESGKLCERRYTCSKRNFCSEILWKNALSKHKFEYCGGFLKVKHTITQSQRHLLSLSMVGKSALTVYTIKPYTIVNSRICPEVEKCGYNSYCKGILVTLQKGKRKPLYEVKCELDLRYSEKSKV